MAYRIEPNGESKDIVWSGFENGIGRSPLSGIANIKGGNISTQEKAVLCSFGRTQQTATTSSAIGSLSYASSTTVSLSINGSNNKFKGFWITVTSSSNTGVLPNQDYYVLPSSGSNFQLANYYNAAAISGLTVGLTASFTLKRNMSKPVAYTTETYVVSGVRYYRYYVLDTQGLVWVYDTQYENTYTSSDNFTWFLPDASTSYFTGTAPSGLAILNGWLHVFSGNNIWCKPTVNLASSTSATSNYVQFASGKMQNIPTNANPHFALASTQGTLYYTDGLYVGSIYPDTSLVSGVGNIQSYASYTASSTTGTISQLFSGSIPDDALTTTRIPAIFFTSLTSGAALPSALSANTVYYIHYLKSNDTFEVYAAASGGAALNLQTGASGTQYFNTYYPTAAGGTATITYTPDNLTLPAYETATAIGEAGNLVVIGTQNNTLYPWNQVDPLPSDVITLPEKGTVYMLPVNNMLYIFAGNKGNVYITNGSTASLVLTVPDYCAGVAGTPESYVEPYFIWGGAAYVRGRVYFSIQDQTSSKTGNCGGIWSFVPTQNFYYGQDTGLALRLENQNSYATYNGAASVIIASANQQAKSPQYWSGWYSGLSSVTYGIDFTAATTVAAQTTVIETDMVPTGTMLEKTTFTQLEFKMSTPILRTGNSESVAIAYRLNSTDTFTSAGTVEYEGGTNDTQLSGYVPVNFEKGQWLQLQITLTPGTSTTTNSYLPLVEVRARAS